MEEDFEYYVDNAMEPDPALNQLTNAIIGAAIEVHRDWVRGISNPPMKKRWPSKWRCAELCSIASSTST